MLILLLTIHYCVVYLLAFKARDEFVLRFFLEGKSAAKLVDMLKTIPVWGKLASIALRYYCCPSFSHSLGIRSFLAAAVLVLKAHERLLVLII